VRAGTRRRAVLGLTLVGTLLLSACSMTNDNPETVGADFTFVAPGGKTTIMYDPPESRRPIEGMKGESLLKPGVPTGVDDFPGKPVIVNIWGSWCGPCRAETPDLQAVQDATGVPVLGLDVRDDRAEATDFIKDRGLRYDSIFDAPARVLASLHGYPRNTVPSTIVFDKQHRVAAVYLTTIRVSELIPFVQKLDAE
jgi:thiol-disulfide isomerase/thioredoxin